MLPERSNEATRGPRGASHGTPFRREVREHDRAIAQVEEELRDRIKRTSPSRVALMKLKLARLREGLSLGEIAEKAGIDRGNLSKLENNADNVEIDTLARLADVLGYDVVVDLRKRL